MQAVIANHLNIAVSDILRVEEWANVFFVVIRRLGGRFVSKKVKTMARKEVAHRQYAQEIADKINSGDHYYISYSLSASVWTKKNGETRVYVNGNKKGGKRDSFGYFTAYSDGEVCYAVKSYLQDWFREITAEVRKEFKLVKEEVIQSAKPVNLSDRLCEDCGVREGFVIQNGRVLCCDCCD